MSRSQAVTESVPVELFIFYSVTQLDECLCFRLQVFRPSTVGCFLPGPTGTKTIQEGFADSLRQPLPGFGLLIYTFTT